MIKRRKFNFDIDDFLTSPLVLWIIAIGLSVALWLHVTAVDESEYITRKFSRPIEYRHLDAQAILRGRVSEVDIEIRGAEANVLNLNIDNVKAYIDARNLTPGNRYTQNVSLELPDNINLVSCVPSQVVLDLARQITRLIQVEINLPENIPEGQYVEGVEIIPEDDIAKVGALRISPSFEELQAGRELLMPVRFSQSEPFTGTVTIEPAQVRFRGTIARGLPRKRVPVNVKLTGELNGDYEIKSLITDPSEIQIEGETDLLAKIDAIDTETVDISLFEDDNVIVVPLKTSTDYGLINPLSTKSVKLTLQLGEVHAEKRLSNIAVSLKNADPLLKWQVNPSRVNVVISGRPSLIEKFNADENNLHAFADLSNIFVTPATLPVRVEIKSSDVFDVVRIEPQTVTVISSN